MKLGISILFTGIFVLFSLHCSMQMMGPQVLHRETPDAFEIFAKFPHLVAISDSNNDTIMECLTLERTELDVKERTAAYMFLFRGHHGTEKRNVTFYVTEGSAPDRVVFYAVDDPELKNVVIFPYTNYINCFLADGPYHNGEQCMLFVSKGTEDNVPEDCIEHSEDVCGVTVSEYSQDLCADG